MIWVLRDSIAITTEMPIELPTLRIRLKIAEPSVRRCTGKVAKAMVESGTKTKPRPKPCTSPVQITGPISIWSEKPVMSHRE